MTDPARAPLRDELFGDLQTHRDGNCSCDTLADCYVSRNMLIADALEAVSRLGEPEAPAPATLRQTLELDGPEPAPLRVAGFLRHYAGMIRKNERWDLPETMANAYESAALSLEKYHAEAGKPAESPVSRGTEIARAYLRAEIARILSPAIDARAPYAVQMIETIAELAGAEALDAAGWKQQALRSDRKLAEMNLQRLRDAADASPLVRTEPAPQSEDQDLNPDTRGGTLEIREGQDLPHRNAGDA